MTPKKTKLNSRQLDPAAAWIWLIFSTFFFVMGLALALDAWQIKKCNLLFDSEGKIAKAEISRIKKNRRGQYAWDLTFKTSNGKTSEGETISGRRVAVKHDGKGNPIAGETPTVIYAPSNLKCWELSRTGGQINLPRAERQLIFLLTSLFGSLLLIMAVLGSTWSVWRLIAIRMTKTRKLV